MLHSRLALGEGFKNWLENVMIITSKVLPSLFKKYLNVGFLKDHISNFVAEGVTANEAFQLTISNAFRAHARLGGASFDSRYAIAREAIPVTTISDDESSGEVNDFGSSSEVAERNSAYRKNWVNVYRQVSVTAS